MTRLLWGWETHATSEDNVQNNDYQTNYALEEKLRSLSQKIENLTKENENYKSQLLQLFEQNKEEQKRILKNQSFVIEKTYEESKNKLKRAKAERESNSDDISTHSKQIDQFEQDVGDLEQQIDLMNKKYIEHNKESKLAMNNMELGLVKQMTNILRKISKQRLIIQIQSKSETLKKHQNITLMTGLDKYIVPLDLKVIQMYVYLEIQTKHIIIKIYKNKILLSSVVGPFEEPKKVDINLQFLAGDKLTFQSDTTIKSHLYIDLITQHVA